MSSHWTFLIHTHFCPHTIDIHLHPYFFTPTQPTHFHTHSVPRLSTPYLYLFNCFIFYTTFPDRTSTWALELQLSLKCRLRLRLHHHIHSHTLIISSRLSLVWYAHTHDSHASPARSQDRSLLSIPLTPTSILHELYCYVFVTALCTRIVLYTHGSSQHSGATGDVPVGECLRMWCYWITSYIGSAWITSVLHQYWLPIWRFVHALKRIYIKTSNLHFNSHLYL